MKENKVNPFIEELTIDAGREVTDFHEYMKNKKAHDASGNIPTTRLERSEKIFVYTAPTIRHILCSLSGSAAKLVLWIQQTVKYSEDYFTLNGKKFMAESGISAPTLIKIKQELIDKHIIAIKSGKQYWINPAIMFKGNRVKKFPESIAVFKSVNPNLTSDSKIQ